MNRHSRYSWRVAAAVALVAPVLVTTPGAAAPAARAAELSQDEAEDRALRHVRAEARELGVAPADVAELAVVSSHRSKHTGVTHVDLGQRHKGRQVFGAYSTVSLEPDGDVLFVGDSLVPGLRSAPVVRTSTAAEAVRAAAAGLGLRAPVGVRVLSERPSPAGREVVLSSAGISDAPITAVLGWHAGDGPLRPAWQVVIDDVDSHHLWAAVVDAVTGRLLDQVDWTVSEPVEPMAAALGHPDGGASAGPVAPPDPVADGSGYRVLALPAESPNDGARVLVSEPADAAGSPLGWHDTDGTTGPEHTSTRGNNVHAYTDRDANNAADTGGEPDGGAGLDFDFPMDLGEHPQTYADAATTNLFYTSNVLHDVLHRYGFDEPAGNFQVNNYGRGGAGGDHLRAEAADGGGHNNANFSTPAQDGQPPRMQMFLWPGNHLGLPNVVTAGGTTYQADYARFTPAATSAGLSGTLVAVDDGVPAPSLTDGCESYTLPAGSIALVDRSATSLCTYRTQVERAQEAGALALVVANNAGGTTTMSGSMDPPATIPAVMVSQGAGAALREAADGPVTVARNTARPPMRDGDLENGIIAHEYGHGLSLRLTGGPTVNCLTGQEQMGEGWSDWLALALLLDPAVDDPETGRGMGPYALFQDSRHGDGIRPRPYSRDMAVNPFTYDHIKTGHWQGSSLAAPHGVGWGWATVLWDMTWNLIDAHGFNPDVYDAGATGGNTLALQLVVDGLKMQGCSPGFVVGRDAILAAEHALTGGDNACLLWSTFARRGLGYSALQGTSASRDDNVQAFDLHPDCRPEVDVAPSSIAAAVTEGGTTPSALSVRNLAPAHGGTLTWSVTEATADCASPSDLPWLSVGTAAGSTAAGSESTVPVTLDATALPAPARVEGLLCVGSDDGDEPLVAVPVSLQAQYPMSGFAGPVESPPAVNRVNRGATVPVQFSLGGDRGTDVLAAGSPTSRPFDCTSGAPTGPADPTRSTSRPVLTYDADSERYAYRWQTETAWTGTCRELLLSLVDGSTHTALFRFR